MVLQLHPWKRDRTLTITKLKTFGGSHRRLLSFLGLSPQRSLRPLAGFWLDGSHMRFGVVHFVTTWSRTTDKMYFFDAICRGTRATKELCPARRRGPQIRSKRAPECLLCETLHQIAQKFHFPLAGDQGDTTKRIERLPQSTACGSTG